MNPLETQGQAARRLDAAGLRQALPAARADTLSTFQAYQRALGEAPQVPCHPEFNPPLWELGHVGWFQSYWLARNPQWRRGVAADPDIPRHAPRRPGADELYHSGQVPHDSRWALPLPSADATCADLALQLQESLELLRDAADDDSGLYFHRLALFHEDMHHEAALYMAQALDVKITDTRWQQQPVQGPRLELALPAQRWTEGCSGPGFAFDNELGAHDTALAGCSIDSRVLSWAEYLPVVEQGQAPRTPRYLRRVGGQWQQRRHGDWIELDLSLPACHLSLAEAETWCDWAGRRLPTEAEWTCAALTLPGFAWGDVWEWTASTFEPRSGFVPHPYRDYSAPWFGSRRVLKGASFATQARLHNARYRNFFTPERSDIFAGFRSCSR
jgi:gamma-glutamyl hercynylcysteine S-oxide synthase